MADTVVTFERVSKRFGNLEVLRDVSLSLRRGECVALTGRNGSGKTTMLRLAAGLTLPSQGRITAGRAIRMEYIPESFPRLNVSAYRVLRSLGRAAGMGQAALSARIAALLDAFALTDAAHAPISTYSKGMLQKVAVIQALLRPADVLLMDEPLSGQDAASQDVFLRLAGQALTEGTAILLACHERSLVRSLADRVFDIRGGALLEAAEPIRDGTDAYLFEAPAAGFTLPESLPGCMRIREDGRGILVRVPRATGDGMLLQMLQAGCRLKEMRREENR